MDKNVTSYSKFHVSRSSGNWISSIHLFIALDAWDCSPWNDMSFWFSGGWDFWRKIYFRGDTWRLFKFLYLINSVSRLLLFGVLIPSGQRLHRHAPCTCVWGGASYDGPVDCKYYLIFASFSLPNVFRKFSFIWIFLISESSLMVVVSISVWSCLPLFAVVCLYY